MRTTFYYPESPYGRTYADVITKLSRMPSLPNYLSYVLRSRALRARKELRYHDNCRAQWEAQTVSQCPGWGGSKSCHQGHT